MGIDDSRALTDCSLEELDTITTSGAATTDYVLVIDATTKKPSLMTIADMNDMHDSI